MSHEPRFPGEPLPHPQLQGPPIVDRPVIYSPDFYALGALGLTAAHVAILRRNGELTLPSLPVGRSVGGFLTSKPMPFAFNETLIRVRHRDPRVGNPLLVCVAGAEYLYQIPTFEWAEWP